MVSWSHDWARQGRAERSQQQVKVFNEWSHPSYFRATRFPSGECALSCMWTRCGGSSWLASIEKPVTGFIHECVCVCVHARTYGGQNTGCILRQGFSLNMELRLVASKPDNPGSAPPQCWCSGHVCGPTLLFMWVLGVSLGSLHWYGKPG